MNNDLERAMSDGDFYRLMQRRKRRTSALLAVALAAAAYVLWLVLGSTL